MIELKPRMMAKITFIAAVLSALILVLPILGVQIPSRIGASGPLACAHIITGNNRIVGMTSDVCANFYTSLSENAGWECSVHAQTQSGPYINVGPYKGEQTKNIKVYCEQQPIYGPNVDWNWESQTLYVSEGVYNSLQ